MTSFYESINIDKCPRKTAFTYLCEHPALVIYYLVHLWTAYVSAAAPHSKRGGFLCIKGVWIADNKP